MLMACVLGFHRQEELLSDSLCHSRLLAGVWRGFLQGSCSFCRDLAGTFTGFCRSFARCADFQRSFAGRRFAGRFARKNFAGSLAGLTIVWLYDLCGVWQEFGRSFSRSLAGICRNLQGVLREFCRTCTTCEEFGGSFAGGFAGLLRLVRSFAGLWRDFGSDL